MKILNEFWNGFLYTLKEAFTNRIFYTICFFCLFAASVLFFKVERVVSTCLVFLLFSSIYWLYSLFRYSESMWIGHEGIGLTLRISLMTLASVSIAGVFEDTHLNILGCSLVFLATYIMTIGAYLHHKQNGVLDIRL